VRIDQGHAMAPYRCIQGHRQTRSAAPDDQQIKGAALLQGGQQISPSSQCRDVLIVNLTASVCSADRCPCASA
jgi:hypothetical protein